MLTISLIISLFHKNTIIKINKLPFGVNETVYILYNNKVCKGEIREITIYPTNIIYTIYIEKNGEKAFVNKSEIVSSYKDRIKLLKE
jgi:hypothetical protein